MSSTDEDGQSTLGDISGADVPRQELPPHLEPVGSGNHDGRCSECGSKITLAKGVIHKPNTELGHQKDPPRCPHRPGTTDPVNPYGDDDG